MDCADRYKDHLASKRCCVDGLRLLTVDFKHSGSARSTYLAAALLHRHLSLVGMLVFTSH